MLTHAKIIRTFSANTQIISKMKIGELIMQQALINLEETSTDDIIPSETSASSFYKQFDPDDL